MGAGRRAPRLIKPRRGRPPIPPWCGAPRPRPPFPEDVFSHFQTRAGIGHDCDLAQFVLRPGATNPSRARRRKGYGLSSTGGHGSGGSARASGAPSATPEPARVLRGPPFEQPLRAPTRFSVIRAPPPPPPPRAFRSSPGRVRPAVPGGRPRRSSSGKASVNPFKRSHFPFDSGRPHGRHIQDAKPRRKTCYGGGRPFVPFRPAPKNPTVVEQPPSRKKKTSARPPTVRLAPSKPAP